MRLSDVKGERVLEVIAEAAEPLGNIVSDPEMRALFKKGDAGEDGEAYAVKRLARAVPAIVRAHGGDIVAVLAAIEGTTPEQYAEGMTLPSLLSDVHGLVTDEELVGFLLSSQTSAAGGPSGAA